MSGCAGDGTIGSYEAHVEMAPSSGLGPGVGTVLAVVLAVALLARRR